MSTTLSIDPDERSQLEQLARTTKDAKTVIRIRATLACLKTQNIRGVRPGSLWLPHNPEA